jgi:ABC-type molybdate transport system substrate-binding protein
MKIVRIQRVLIIFLIVVIFLWRAIAMTAEIHVMSAGAVKAAVTELAKDFQKAAGHEVRFTLVLNIINTLTYYLLDI